MSNSKLLYQIVYDTLHARILSGTYHAGDLLPSEREIGEQFEVDRTTVRKALQLLVEEQLVVKLPGIGTKIIGKDPLLPESVKIKTESRGKSNGTIGFFLPPSVHRTDRISQPFYSSLFYYTEKEARARGYSCIYSTLDENDDFEEMLERQHYEGIIFLSNTPEKFITIAQNAGIPCILTNEYSNQTLSFLADSTNGMIKMCEYLISLGHKRFALISGIESYLTSQERLIGCTYTFAKNSIPEPYYLSCDWEPDTAYQITKKLLLSVDVLPTAIVAFNDNIAFGCLRAASELGLRIPQDISIVGFDDIEQSRYSIPRLTTVHASIETLAKSSLQGLLIQIADPSYNTNLKCYVPCSLSIRDSSGPPPKISPKLTNLKKEQN
ncbi:GntR family transcriptional regulator [Sphaerochaeta sp. PS]|uniref:GntR family transcriptional regulator n=1 Tax=Sphaerochaeta sp. PS TaxID=3076336 RepID=UPI0028A3DBE1|nr:GntR family transcriptional regulator [Sphaerochaeta sp. PS]MDT4763046.1 GntR family transcriptional regulator [Sphaerochaeta sp. PS]